MKKIFLLIILFGLGGYLQSCFFEGEGPQGPPGPRGADGLDGLDGEEAYVFDYTLDFTAPNYQVFLDYPQDFTMLDSDVAIVYLLWFVENDGTEVWRPLPQTLFTQDGTLVYNSDYTVFNASIFLDANFPLDFLTAEYTDQWIARVVIVPGQFGGRAETVDFNNYEEVKAKYNLQKTKKDIGNYRNNPLK